MVLAVETISGHILNSKLTSNYILLCFSQTNITFSFGKTFTLIEIKDTGSPENTMSILGPKNQMMTKYKRIKANFPTQL